MDKRRMSNESMRSRGSAREESLVDIRKEGAFAVKRPSIKHAKPLRKKMLKPSTQHRNIATFEMSVPVHLRQANSMKRSTSPRKGGALRQPVNQNKSPNFPSAAYGNTRNSSPLRSGSRGQSRKASGRRSSILRNKRNSVSRSRSRKSDDILPSRGPTNRQMN